MVKILIPPCGIRFSSTLLPFRNNISLLYLRSHLPHPLVFPGDVSLHDLIPLARFPYAQKTHPTFGHLIFLSFLMQMNIEKGQGICYGVIDL